MSWEIKGVRNDAYAKRVPFVAEQDKKPEDKGKYYDPLSHKQPDEKGIHFIKASNPKQE